MPACDPGGLIQESIVQQAGLAGFALGVALLWLTRSKSSGVPVCLDYLAEARAIHRTDGVPCKACAGAGKLTCPDCQGYGRTKCFGTGVRPPSIGFRI
ncbi:hypothetical protein QJQ45_014239 [Haematococcus lacustris]|nr:hypothetical protein QJQ45_014239 [Haematococcus lacustris]